MPTNRGMLHSALAFFTLAIAAVFLTLIIAVHPPNIAHATTLRDAQQGSVRISPSPILREAAAAHPV